MSPYWPQVDLINVRDRAFHRRGHEADSAPRLTFFVVPTISFRLLYGLLVLRHEGAFCGWVSRCIPPQNGSASHGGMWLGVAFHNISSVIGQCLQ